jgi:hypothetical protein
MHAGIGETSTGISRAPEALELALAGALAERPGAVDELRTAVCAYAMQLRAEGVPPERALVAIKSLAYRGLVVLRPSEEEERRLALVVGWCICAYYDGAA